MSEELQQEQSFDDAFNAAINNRGSAVAEPTAVETPAAVVAEPEAIPAAEAEIKADPTPEPTIKEVEKIVEKVVEKFPEFKNEQSKQLFDLLTGEDADKAEEAILEVLREKKKNYDTMSDLDIMKNAFRKEYKDWTKEEIDAKIRRTYGKDLEKIDLKTIDQELEPEAYDRALAHNEKVEDNLLALKVDAREKRDVLKAAQKSIELPKINKPAPVENNQPSAQEVEEANKRWIATAEEGVRDFSEIKLKVGDEDVSYKLDEDEKKNLTERVKNFNLLNLPKELGWYKEDGTVNVAKLAEDRYYLENKDRIHKSIATQIETKATKRVMAEIKGVDLTTKTPQAAEAQSLADAFYDAIKRK